jgi:hypothetical protein
LYLNPRSAFNFQLQKYEKNLKGADHIQKSLKNWEGNSCGLFKVLYQHLPGGTEENCENPIRIVDAVMTIQTGHLLKTSHMTTCSVKISVSLYATGKLLSQATIKT